MNKLFLIFVLMLAGCVPAFAQTNTISDAKVLEFLNSPMNFVKNPFARYNTNDVTCVNATKNRDVVTDPLFGISAHTFVGTALNGYCEYALRPIDNPYKDFKGGCEFGVFIKGDASLYSLIIYDGTATEKIRSASTLGSNTGFAYYSLPYQCQATPRIRLVQTAAGTGQTVRLGVYYGPAKSIAYGTPPNTFYASISSAGVVSDEQNGDWINGNCGVASNVFTCTFSSGFFNETPYCFGNGYNGLAGSNLDFVVSSTQMQIRPANGSTAGALPMKVTCTKKGSDYVQPAVTAQNWNFGTTSYTTNVSGLGTGSGTASATYDRKGDKTTICIDFKKDGSAGSGSSTVTFSYPPGVLPDLSKSPGGTSIIGTGFSSQYTTNVSLYASASSLQFAQGADTVIGSGVNAGSILRGCVTFPVQGWTETWNALQLNGSVVADTNVKADKAAGITSVDYGTYSAVVTGGANAVSVTSPTTCNFSRIGTFVSVTCPVSVGCTSVTGASNTNFTVSLPISTTNSASINGSMGVAVPQEAGRIAGGTSTAASANFRCFTAGAYNRPVVFSYMTQ